MPYQGGTPRLVKSLPCARNFFLSLTDDFFVICNLKVIKKTEISIITLIFTKSCQKSTQYIFQAISPGG